MSSKKYIFASTIMVMSMCLSAHAQQNNIARIVFQEEIQPESEPLEGIEEALNALRQETRQLRSSTTEESTNISNSGKFSPPTQRPSIEPILEDLRAGMQENAIDGIGNTEDIVERIELLKRIYENKRIEKERKAKEATLKAQTPPTQPPVEPTVSVQPQTPQSTQQPSSTNTRETASTLSPAINRVFQDPVNIFEMGNSLYQAGDLQPALATYVQIDKSELTASEIVWLDFMIASCHRKLGNEEEAIALYRDVANQREVPNLVKPSQSWIRQLKQMSEARANIKSIESEIESILKTAESNVKK